MEEDKIEEGKTYKIRIMFDIDVPKNVEESDFNSLVLRLYTLKQFREANNYEKWSVENNNRNIREIQNTLKNFIVKEVDDFE